MMCRKRKMNMRVTKAEVIKTASDMADRNGLHNVSYLFAYLLQFYVYIN